MVALLTFIVGIILYMASSEMTRVGRVWKDLIACFCVTQFIFCMYVIGIFQRSSLTYNVRISLTLVYQPLINILKEKNECLFKKK